MAASRLLKPRTSMSYANTTCHRELVPLGGHTLEWRHTQYPPQCRLRQPVELLPLSLQFRLSWPVVLWQICHSLSQILVLLEIKLEVSGTSSRLAFVNACAAVIKSCIFKNKHFYT